MTKRRLLLWIAAILLSFGSLTWIHFSAVHAQTRITFTTGQVSVTGSATSILAADPQRTGLLITNTGTVAVYIGASGVTTATGAYLPGGTSISIPTRDAVFGISSGANQTVTFLVTYSSF